MGGGRGTLRTYLPATTVGALEQYCVRGNSNEEVDTGPAAMRATRSAKVARTKEGRPGMLSGKCD